MSKRDVGFVLLLTCQTVVIAVLGAWDAAASKRLDDLQRRVDCLQLERDIQLIDESGNHAAKP